MKIAIYPGSFNPWHVGHWDILMKAKTIFDKIIIAKGVNLEKNPTITTAEELEWVKQAPLNTECTVYHGLLSDYVKEYEKANNVKINAIIRGLRNGYDLQYEMNLQYNNEDLGLNIPFVYFVTDRKFSHISSSALREIERFKNK